ncbi:hypothetical protein [Thermosporothrix hazakensis]|uniref:hypothetical protein n=1 Tax=Thermosporothrix hazakensis TaxID=644383 RepID=UPI001B86B5F7|nr:hypothetical protein [Thermosporothrix hazakensis]
MREGSASTGAGGAKKQTEKGADVTPFPALLSENSDRYRHCSAAVSGEQRRYASVQAQVRVLFFLTPSMSLPNRA